MEDKRGFSLRQKKPSRRPAISAPKQLSSQSTTASPASQAPPRTNGLSDKPTKTNRERANRPGEKTADLVKRRYSTRFVQTVDFSNAEAPPLPSDHPANVNPKLNLPASGPANSVNVDITALKDPDLDPEKCKLVPHLLLRKVLTLGRHRLYNRSCRCF